MSSPDSHSRFKAQLILREAALLSEEEEASLSEHLDSCESCREVVAEAGTDREDRGEARDDHIPSAMLARWDRVQSSVRGLERDLLSRHIESCQTCREELELAGHQATLTGEPQGPPLVVNDDKDLSRSARVLTLTPRLRRRAWLQGALAGVVLTAAAAAIVLRPPPSGLDPGTLPWVVPGTTRGSAPAVEIPSGASKVLLAISTPTGLSPESRVRLTVEGPGGLIRMDLDLTPDLLESPTIMAVLSSPDPLEPGIYTVHLTPANGGEPHTSSFQIRVSGR